MIKGHSIIPWLGISTFVMTLLVVLMMPHGVFAGSGVVISRAQLAGATTNTSAEEYVTIYNNSASDINVTGWCLFHSTTKMGCITTKQPQVQIYLSARSSVLFMNPTLEAIIKNTNPTFKADVLFGSSGSMLATTNGSLQLLNAQNQVVDILGWGNGIANGTAAAGSVATGKLLQRQVLSGDELKDTKNNSADFEAVLMDTLYARGGLYDYEQPLDLCLNTPDSIDLVVPEGFMRDELGNCYEDLCDNLLGLQAVVPIGYRQIGIDCVMNQVLITELLPNPVSTDTGKEFIELYNPNSFAVDLVGYYLQLSTSTKKYTFSQSFTLEPYEYVTLSDTQLSFSLPNTSAIVRLYLPSGQLVHEAAEYTNPKDDMAWGFIDGAWQYTSVLTPGMLNELPMLASDSGAYEADNLESCPEGKFRNPETNRCKNIETEADLKPCAANQERSPETNRCRKTASVASALSACASDQFRNPETNRCKKVASDESTLKACGPGQERNPETNRCRKVATAVSGTALESFSQPAAINPFKYKTPIIGLLSAALVGYGGYEYRNDLRNYLQKIRETRRRRGRPPD